MVPVFLASVGRYGGRNFAAGKHIFSLKNIWSQKGWESFTNQSV